MNKDEPEMGRDHQNGVQNRDEERLMTELTPIEPDAEEHWEADSWNVRKAIPEDVPTIAIAVRELLIELGADPTLPAALEAPARALIEDDSLGVLLVAEEQGQIVGLLEVSWQVAIRIPGRYGLIQELWVHPEWRGRTIGGDLLAALFKLARRQHVTRIEVGLPSERFSHLPATEAFYVNCGFKAIGMRMRILL